MDAPERRVARAARFVIYANLLLVAGKVAVGLVTGAVSILSDAANSGLDLLVSGVIWALLRVARRPADDTHPYGHGKVETLASFMQGVLILAVAGGLVWEGVRSLREGPQVAQVEWGIAAVLLAAATSGAMSRYVLRVAREAASPALEATGQDMRADVFATVGVFAGLVLVRVTGWAVIDPLVGLAVAGVVTWSGGRVLVGAVRDLTDGQLPPEEVAAIRDVLDAHADTFIEYHALRTRHVGGTHAIDLHLVVPRTMSVGEAHDLSSHLEDEIAVALPDTDVTIHMEPEDEAEGLRREAARSAR